MDPRPTSRSELHGPSRRDRSPRRRRAVSALLIGAIVASALPVLGSTLPEQQAGRTRGSSAFPALVGTVNGNLIGRVTTPLDEAAVYAYRVTDLTLHRARTDRRGSFTFSRLPAGVYKVIAHKAGFLPAIVLVTRTTASAFQELQLELFPDDGDTRSTSSSDFWQIRKRIPRDVLREIQIALAEPSPPVPEVAPSLRPVLSAQINAIAGSGRFANFSEASVAGGQVDVDGRIGSTDLSFVGNYRHLQQQQVATTLGQAQSLALQLDRDDSALEVHSWSGSVADPDAPLDVERYGVAWRAQTGPGRTEVSARYLTEQNYFRDPRLDTLALPSSSRTVEVSGSYEQRLTPRTAVQTGLRYRGRQAGSASLVAPTDHVEVFGVGELSIASSASVRYGLFTSLRNGDVAFAPHAGFAIPLKGDWSLETSFRHRIKEQSDAWISDFLPAYHSGALECSSAEEGCYRLELIGDLDERGTLEVGALHRRYDDTLRLYFSDDVFDQLDSLFFVDGDEIPELQFAYSRRLGPTVMTRFATQIARGGGGTVANQGQPLRNDVRYLVTSLDTDFEGSHTGVLLSFHSLEQRLLDTRGGTALEAIATDRLQLLVTQGLGHWVGLTQDLQLVLDMQFSRAEGSDLGPAAELERRVLGGIALRF